VGLFLLLGANGLVTWAEQWVPSGLTALLLATMPLCMAILGGLVEPESRPRRRGVAGILLGFAGVAILVEPRGELATDMHVLLGALGILAGAFLWSTGSLLSRRVPLPKNGSLATGMQMIGGGVGCLVVGMVAGEWARVDVGAVTTRSLVSLVYLIVFGSLVAFSAFTWLLRNAPPAKVATYAYVNPLVAVFLGWALAGETVSARTLVASAVIIASVVMITSERATAAAARGRPTGDLPSEEPA
jgi:drug/metabolite transporter (DMT)-like permease